jgi:hypothetical protein
LIHVATLVDPLSFCTDIWIFVFALLNDVIKGCVHPLDAEARVLPHFGKKINQQSNQLL